VHEMKNRSILVVTLGALLFCSITILSTKLPSVTVSPRKRPLQNETKLTKNVQIRKEEPLTFFVVGDWGIDTTEHWRVAEQLKRYYALESPKFVISSGDHVYHEGIEHQSSPQIKNFFGHYKELDVPFFPVVGNHDCRGSVEAQILFSQLEPRWKFPSAFYNVTFNLGERDVRFFFLETCTLVCPADIPTDQVRHTFSGVTYSECEYYSAEKWTPKSMWRTFPDRNSLDISRRKQLEWLNSSLEDLPQTDWKFVIGHHPLLSATVPRYNNKVLERDLLPIFKERHVNGYFSGHDHSLQHLQQDGIDYFVSGGGGFTGRHPLVDHSSKQFAESTWGFLIVTLNSSSMTSRYISYEGVELYKIKTYL